MGNYYKCIVYEGSEELRSLNWKWLLMRVVCSTLFVASSPRIIVVFSEHTNVSSNWSRFCTWNNGIKWLISSKFIVWINRYQPIPFEWNRSILIIRELIGCPQLNLYRCIKYSISDESKWVSKKNSIDSKTVLNINKTVTNFKIEFGIFICSSVKQYILQMAL